MKPTIGISPIKIHQPVRSVSCRRRIATEMFGRISASATIR